MKRMLFAVAILAVAAAGLTAEPGRIPRFEADTSQAPDLQPWGRAAEAVCEVWYPKIASILESDDTDAPKSVRIVFEKQMDGVAYTAGNEIHISADWVRKQPHDFGMVVHELTHVVQRYPSGKAGWLVEGIADYVRLKHFEPQLPRPEIDFTRAKHTDAYKTTAQFLIYLEETHGTDVVPRLNAALRKGTYDDDLLRQITGKPVDALWSDFAEARGKTGPANGS